MITPGIIKLSLPEANNTQNIDKTPKEASISITKDLEYYVNNKRVAFTDIEGELLGLKEPDKELLVIVRSDNTIAVQSLVDVLQLGNKVHVKMVLAATKKHSGNLK